MRFVVEDDDVFLGAQLATGAAHHLVGSFGERAWLPIGENRLRDLAGGDLLTQLESVVVGDDDFGLAEQVL